MNSQQLEAGPGLDALVAEKVMGWGRIPLLSGGWIWSDHPEWTDPLSEGGKGHPPHYSTDIATAWEVVEKMRSTLGHVEVGTNAYGSDWYARFDRYAHGYCPGYAEGETPALAICRAALQAVTVAKSDG